MARFRIRWGGVELQKGIKIRLCEDRVDAVCTWLHVATDGDFPV